MTKIPSIEKTDDFIYRFKIEKGIPQHDHNEPHLLAVQQFVGPAGVFHSMDVTVLRDGQRVKDVEFRSFEHIPQGDMTVVTLTFFDKANVVKEREYIITLILRYMT